MKAGVRRALARLVHARRAWIPRLRGKVVILGYHRVLPEREVGRAFVQPGMYVLDTAFAAQMRFLTEHFTMLSLAQLLSAWREGGLDGSGPHCVVTFDDGWRDNYVHAYPILRQFGIPATIFLATDFVGTDRWFWPDRLGHLLREAGRRRPTRIARRPCSAGAIDRTIERWKPLPREDIEQRLDEMSRAAGLVVPRERTLLSWAEVAEMSAGGISFGSHSATHAILTQLEDAELRREVEQPLAALRRPAVNGVPVFSYPNGDHSAGVVERVRAAGYMGAVTSDAGWETGTPPDLFRLHRIGVHQDLCGTVPLFAFHLAGFNRVLARATGRRAV